jgi:hypothetical protein
MASTARASEAQDAPSTRCGPASAPKPPYRQVISCPSASSSAEPTYPVTAITRGSEKASAIPSSHVGSHVQASRVNATKSLGPSVSLRRSALSSACERASNRMASKRSHSSAVFTRSPLITRTSCGGVVSARTLRRHSSRRSGASPPATTTDTPGTRGLPCPGERADCSKLARSSGSQSRSPSASATALTRASQLVATCRGTGTSPRTLPRTAATTRTCE